MVRIIEVPANRKDLKKFVDFSRSLYKRNAFYTPNLRFDDINVLLPDKNPAFDYCDAKYFMAYKDKKPAGRIAAIINHAYVEKWGKKNGRFGFVDFIEDFQVAASLFRAAESWLLAKGMEGIQGPLGFTDFDPEGMLIDGFDQKGTFTTIYNHPYYPDYLQRLGFEPDAQWYEFCLKIPEQGNGKIEKFSELAKQRHDLHRIEIKRKKELRSLAPHVFRLTNTCFTDIYCTVELTQKQVDYYTDQYFGFVGVEYLGLIKNGEGEVIAFALALPSISEALRKSKGRLFPFGFIRLLHALWKPKRLELLLLAVVPKYRKKGVNAILLQELIRTCREKGIKEVDLNPQLETNVPILSQWRHFDTVQNKRRVAFYRSLLPVSEENAPVVSKLIISGR